MVRCSAESDILLTIAAIEKDPKLSRRGASFIYKVDFSTLCRRMNGRPSRRYKMPNSRRMNDIGESCIVRYILELNSQGFPPRMADVESMANRLFDQRGAPRAGRNWSSNFVRRQPELKTRFTRSHDYQRALCEDHTLIRGWFTLV